MAKEKTKTVLENELKDKVLEIVKTVLLAELGAEAKNITSNKILLQLADSTDIVRWLRLDIITPQDSRDGTPYDGDGLIADYEATQIKNAELKAKREADSKERQAKREAKDAELLAKLQAKQAEADAEAEAEDTEE